MCATAPSTIAHTSRRTRAPAIRLNWFGSYVPLRSTGRGAFWKDDGNAKIIPRDETQFLERPLFFFTFCRFTMLAVGVFDQAGGRRFERAWFAEDVARVDDTEFFLGEAAFVGAIGVYRAERVPGEGVSELEYVRRGVAKGGQDFAQRGVFPAGHRSGERVWRETRVRTR